MACNDNCNQGRACDCGKRPGLIQRIRIAWALMAVRVIEREVAEINGHIQYCLDLLKHKRVELARRRIDLESLRKDRP